MKKNYILFFCLILFLSINKINAQTSAIYSSTAENTKTGILDGVPFTFSNFANVTQISNFDLSGTDYSALPLSSSQPTFVYSSNENWTLTFDSPIQHLQLYLKYWRTAEIEFTQPFTIISGATTLINPSGNIVQTTDYTDGIIEFNNPITTLSVTVLSGGVNSQIALTLGATVNTLSTDGFEINEKNIKLFPNPTSDYIQISGLTKTENYSVYNVIGLEISKGTISINEKIDVKNYSNGLYFLKFQNGNIIKFIKK
jgi:hypothetical protein